MATTGYRRDPYRIYLELDGSRDALDEIRDEAQAWLESKQYPVDLASDEWRRYGHATVRATHHKAGNGRSFRVQLSEEGAQGIWATDLIAFAGPSAQWISMEVSNSDGNFVDVPRLASTLLDRFDLHRGPVRLTSEPEWVTGSAAEEAVELICDPQRTLPLLVAATASDGSLDITPFRTHLTAWSKQVRGLAQVLLLDPLATKHVNDALGGTHAIPEWTIRTFLPEVDPALREDARRHRILGHARLAGPDRVVAKLLGDVMRAYAASHPAPKHVTAEARALDRVADRLLLVPSEPEPSTDAPAATRTEAPQGTTAPTSPPPATDSGVAEEAARYLELHDLVRGVLGIDEITADALLAIAEAARAGRSARTYIETGTLESLRSEKERAEEERDFHRELAEDLELDLAAEQALSSRLIDENVALRNRLARLQDEAAWAPISDDSAVTPPRDFATYVEEMKERGNALAVIFSGDTSIASDLDASDSLGSFCATTWQITQALAHYVQCRNDGSFDKGVDEYLRSDRNIRQVSPGKHAPTETGVTKQQFGKERMFPVPADVDPSGRKQMLAHFKLGKNGMASPRLYYLDNWHADGKVYIGYIGPHLQNTQTN